jgi:hypothetical protein
MRATIPDDGVLREAREIEDVTDEVTSAESDPPASARASASIAPPLRTGTNGSAAREPAKPTAAKTAAAKTAAARSAPSTRPTPTGRPTRPSAAGGQRTAVVVVLMLGAAAAAAAIVLSRPVAVPEPSPVVTVAVPGPEPSAVAPVPPAPAVAPAQQQIESAAAAPVAVEPAPARPAEREPERPTRERSAAAAKPEPEPAPAAEPSAVTPSPEPALVATGSPTAVAPTAEAAPTYVLSVVTTPEGAQVTAAGQIGISPCSFELGALEAKIEVQATMEGHAPATAVIDRIGFMLDDGRMRRRISLSLPELPKPLPDPEPVARSSRHRTREPVAAPVPKPGAKPPEKGPSATPMQAAMTCLTTGDNACAIKALEGKTRSAQELELLIETYRTLGNSAKAERWMQTYVDKYPSERRANTYRRQLERRVTESQ